MEKLENSCGKRGCNIRIILPRDSKPKHVIAEMLPVKRDSSKVLLMAKLPLDKVAQKAAA